MRVVVYTSKKGKGFSAKGSIAIGFVLVVIGSAITLGVQKLRENKNRDS